MCLPITGKFGPSAALVNDELINISNHLSHLEAFPSIFPLFLHFLQQ
jgi:hypothetical protein